MSANSRRSHIWLAAVSLAAVILLGFPTAPSSSVVVKPPAPPDAEELRLIQDLASWVVGRGGTAAYGLAGTGMVATIRDRRQSFELFRRYNDDESRRRLVEGLPYGGVIHLAAQSQRLDSLLLAAVVEAESGFNPTVISSKGALGLMQLMPETAARFGARDPMNPGLNVAAGARYLRNLLDRYHGDLELALAAYNAGPGNVRRYGGVPPFRETVRYVDKVLSRYVVYHRSLWRGSEVGELLQRVEPWVQGEMSDPDREILATLQPGPDGVRKDGARGG